MKAKLKLNFSPLQFFKNESKVRSAFSVLLTLAFLNLSTGCSYYRVKSVPSQNNEQMASQIKAFNEADKYIILHKNQASLNLANPEVKEGTMEFTGITELLSQEHVKEDLIKPGKSYRYKNRKSSPLNEVHIYLKDGEPLALGATTIPIEDIETIAITNKNAGKTVLNAALGTVGVFALLLVVVALTKSSCPFVYSDSGDGWVFSGELYPGNIIKNAQQTDYLPLPSLRESDGELHIQITNELLEIQHTDLAQLVVVKHPENTKALLDKQGGVILYGEVQSPDRVFVDGRIQDREPALETDGQAYQFDTPIPTKNSKRNVVFTFKKPRGSREARLYLTAKNSLWLDYVFGRFNEKFGVYYNTFQESQLHTTEEEARTWREEQNIPLTVSVKKNGQWEMVDQISSVGPLAYRDLGLKIDLAGIEQEEVEVKLETGYMFWEVDYIGIDYEVDLPFESVLLDPHRAVTEEGEEVTHLLKKKDEQYLTQGNVGDRVDIRFLSPSTDSGYSYSYFLKNRGYYTYVRDYQGVPDFSELRKFRNPNTFTRFSENEYHRILNAIQSKKEGYVIR